VYQAPVHSDVGDMKEHRAKLKASLGVHSDVGDMKVQAYRKQWNDKVHSDVGDMKVAELRSLATATVHSDVGDMKDKKPSLHRPPDLDRRRGGSRSYSGSEWRPNGRGRSHRCHGQGR